MSSKYSGQKEKTWINTKLNCHLHETCLQNIQGKNKLLGLILN
jgi:hypothetical protein